MKNEGKDTDDVKDYTVCPTRYGTRHFFKLLTPNVNYS